LRAKDSIEQGRPEESETGKGGRRSAPGDDPARNSATAGDMRRPKERVQRPDIVVGAPGSCTPKQPR
jgi:hypothetical protein